MTVTEKFDLCLATTVRGAEERRRLLWRMGGVSLPCVAGNEYSMAQVRRPGTDVLEEAESPGSLATCAVVPNGRDAERLDDGPWPCADGRTVFEGMTAVLAWHECHESVACPQSCGGMRAVIHVHHGGFAVA